jgi:hypothetical protein
VLQRGPLVAHLALGLLQLAQAMLILGDQRFIVALQPAQRLGLPFQLGQGGRQRTALVGLLSKTERQTHQVAP